MSLANIITLASEAEAQQAGYRNARNCPWVRHVSAHCPRQFPGVLAGVLFSAILMSGLPKTGEARLLHHYGMRIHAACPPHLYATAGRWTHASCGGLDG